MIYRTLQAVRSAENEGRALNRSFITIQFDPADEKGDNLIEWMQQSIDDVGQSYETAKTNFTESAGFEDGYGIAQVTISAASEQEIIRNLLGLGNGLALNKFTFTEHRFGIALASPSFDLSFGTLRVTPEPAASVEIRLRSSRDSEVIVLNGHIYNDGLTHRPPDEQYFRFSAEFLEIIWKPGLQFDFQLIVDLQAEYDIKTLINYASLVTWLQAGPVDLQAWVDGKRTLWGTLSRKTPASKFDVRELASGLRLLATFPGHERAKITIRQLCEASGLKTFSDISNATHFRIEGEIISPASDAPFDVLMYFYTIDVGTYTFYQIASRRVTQDIALNTNLRSLTTSKQDTVESYVLENTTASDRKMMSKDYDRYVEQLSSGTTHLLNVGDLRRLLEAPKRTRE